MKRQAILIETSQLHGHPDLPGARVDMANWASYLRSNAGGAWDDSEILPLSKPSWSALQARIALEKETDYVFIAFSGHGYYSAGKDNDETRICLNDTEEIPVSQLIPENPRCTIIIDACRQLVTEEVIIEAFAANQMVRSASYEDRAAYRRIFEAAIAQAEVGAIRMYSCDINESANESPRFGGYYTDALLRCCSNWHDNTDGGNSYYYSTWKAHECAAARTTQRDSHQHPQYCGGRRNKHFPLAIKP